MSILQLQANLPTLVGHYDGVITIYVRQYGAGNLRLGMTREDLINTNPAVLAPGQVVDGIPQAAADGIKQYFWSGDLWMISDVAGAVVLIAPAQTFYIDRSNGIKKIPADNVNFNPEADLSTYQNQT